MSKQPLSLAFVGDVCLWRIGSAQNGIAEFTGWPAIKDAIGEHDFLVGNLECCLVDDRCSEEARRQIMAVPAEAASFLSAMGFSDLCLANNHILDCGPEAIDITRQYLSAHNIRSVGAGSDLAEAEETVFAKRNGCQVAFLNICDDSEYYATDRRAGIAPLKKSRLGHRLRAAAKKADLVVVTLHADLEFTYVPGRWRRRLCHWLIEQGAHLVIQHHPHVLQGVETYQDGLIAYSLGNFIFRVWGNGYQESKAGVSDSLVLVVDADLSGTKPKLTYRVIPVCIGKDHLPYQVTGPDREQAVQKIQALSSLIVDKSAHRRIWFQRCRAEAMKRIFSIYYALRRGQFKRGMREFWQLLTRPEDRRWVLGLLSLGLY